jgi:hypothetical protein
MTTQLSSSDIDAISQILDNPNPSTDFVYIIDNITKENLNVNINAIDMFTPTDRKKVNIIIAYLGQTCKINNDFDIKILYDSSGSPTVKTPSPNIVSLNSKTALKNILNSPNSSTDRIIGLSDLTSDGTVIIDIGSNVANSLDTSLKKSNIVLVYRGVNSSISATLSIKLSLNNKGCDVCQKCDKCETCQKCDKCETCQKCPDQKMFTTPSIMIIILLFILMLIFLCLYMFSSNKKKNKINNDY